MTGVETTTKEKKIIRTELTHLEHPRSTLAETQVLSVKYLTSGQKMLFINSRILLNLLPIMSDKNIPTVVTSTI
jgi:hypothetical protein